MQLSTAHRVDKDCYVYARNTSFWWLILCISHVLAVLPLLLLFCLCGGAGDVGGFKPMPWEAKQHLVDYNCEGQGEDKVSAVRSLTARLLLYCVFNHSILQTGRIKWNEWNESPQLKHAILTSQDVPMVILVTEGKVDLTGAAGSHLSQSNINNGHYHWFNQVNTDHGTWYGQHGQGFGGSSVQRGAFEGIALSEEFLRNYYSNVSVCLFIYLLLLYHFHSWTLATYIVWTIIKRHRCSQKHSLTESLQTLLLSCVVQTTALNLVL